MHRLLLLSLVVLFACRGAEPEAVEGEIIDAGTATRQEMMSAMNAYVEAHGLAKARDELPRIMGYKRQSDVPDDPAIFGEIKAKIERSL